MNRRSVASLILTMLLGLTGCAAPLPTPAPTALPAGAPFNGGVLEPVRRVPPLPLRRADGQPFNTAASSGRLALYFFGYTFCPDVCPLTLLHVSQLRQALGPDAAAVDTYFVTVDPERDSPARLAEYTARFDPAIVGLSGTDEELEQARTAFGVVAQQRPLPNSVAGYLVDHSAGLYLVDRDGTIRLLYPYGTPPNEIATDIKRILAASPPANGPQPTTAPLAPEAHPPPRPGADISFARAWARPATAASGAMNSTGAIYLTIENRGAQDDTLVSAHTEVANATELHVSSMDNGVMRMHPAGALRIPAGGELTLQPGGLHIMLIGLRQDLSTGGEVTVTLTFERAGDLILSAPIHSAG